MEPIECPECEEGFMVYDDHVYTCDTCDYETSEDGLPQRGKTFYQGTTQAEVEARVRADGGYGTWHPPVRTKR